MCIRRLKSSQLPSTRWTETSLAGKVVPAAGDSRIGSVDCSIQPAVSILVASLYPFERADMSHIRSGSSASASSLDSNDPSQSCRSEADGLPRMLADESELRIMVKSIVLKMVRIRCVDGWGGAASEKSDGNMLWADRPVGGGPDPHWGG